MVQLASELLGRQAGPAGPDLSGLRIACLGVTFKPNSDDVRDSPALSVTRRLARTGAATVVYDPEGTENARRAAGDLVYAGTLAEAVTGADLVCVLTEWEEFRNADPQAIAGLTRGRRVIDGRNCLDRALWTAAGWEYRGIGR